MHAIITCVRLQPPPPQSGATRWRVVFAFEVELDFEAITDEHHSLRVLFFLFIFIFYLFIYLFFFFEGCG